MQQIALYINSVMNVLNCNSFAEEQNILMTWQLEQNMQLWTSAAKHQRAHKAMFVT